jgi:hypothetical protein
MWAQAEACLRLAITSPCACTCRDTQGRTRFTLRCMLLHNVSSVVTHSWSSGQATWVCARGASAAADLGSCMAVAGGHVAGLCQEEGQEGALVCAACLRAFKMHAAVCTS